MTTTMTLNQNHNGMKADRRAEAEQTYTHVILCLRDHPCVSFALSYCGRVHWSPELDVAVRLMLLVTDGGLVPSDQMVVDVNPRWITPDRIEAGKRALADCISLLRSSGIPFTLLGHVHGQTKVEYQFMQNDQEFPLTTIADAVAAEVKCFGRG